MTGRGRLLASRLLKLAGVAVLIAASIALFRRGAATSGPVPTPQPLPTRSPQSSALVKTPSMTPELVTYSIGYALALALTAAAFALVHWHWAPAATALMIVFALALAQMIVHFRCFLHVTLRGPSRDDLQLIVFSTVIILLMVGGTLVVLFNLRTRMM